VIALPKLAASLEKIEPGTDLHIDFENLKYIDHACLELLVNWQKQHDKLGGQLTIDWDSLNARFRENMPLKTTGTLGGVDTPDVPPRGDAV
jgi:ABC-type transporter Mla MlaB component